MFDFLPPAESDELTDAPLVTVIAQVRFNNQNVLSTHQGASTFHSSVIDNYPRFLAEPQSTITANAGGVSSTAVPQWRLTDFEKIWACVVGPEQLAIETKSYSTWPVMRARLEEALLALDGVSGPRVRERIGLRYVNHIPPNTSGSFTGMVSEHLLGLTEVAGWKEAMALSLTQVMVSSGTTQMAIRYGRGSSQIGLPDGAWVLDIDCADETPSPFEASNVLTYFDDLNDAALRCFHASLGRELKMSLGGGSR